MRASWITTGLLVGLLVGGCGGGGGGDNSGGDTPLANITAANSAVVAETAVTGISVVSGAGDLGAAFIEAGGTLPREGASARKAVAAATRQVTRRAAAVMEPSTEPCDAGMGSMTLTWTDADSSLDLSTGDSLSVDAADCFIDDPSEPMTLDGSMSVQVILLSPPYAFEFGLGFQTLRVTDTAGGVVVVRGAMTVSSHSDDGITFSNRARGASLDATATGPASTFKASLRDFDVTTATNWATSTYTSSGSGLVSSSALAGDFVRVDSGTTLAALQGLAGTSPTAGALFITGDGPATLTVQATGGGFADLQFDGDGDGEVDQVTSTTWDELGF